MIARCLTLLLLVISMPVLSDDNCRKLYRITDLNYAIEPGIPVEATDTIPAYCSVTGVINRAIRFTVNMPEDWNGKMMFSGVGGGAGVIGDTTSLLGQGFAMASTDTGHEAREGMAYYEQPEALIDYAFRGTHLATVAAKKLITTFYSKTIDYSYFQGCSNGGRAGMLEAARFPDDYDGIIAGAPAFQFVEMAPWMEHVARAQEAHPLTMESLVILDNASREACDTLDGVEDGVINDPRICTDKYFDIDTLVCVAGQTEGCLTEGQVETARAVYEDVTDADGNILSPGVPPGAEAAGDWAAWQLPFDTRTVDGATGFEGRSLISGVGEMIGLLMRFDRTFDLKSWDPRDRARISAATSPLDLRTADLSEFRDRGGKLLMYQGWNDYPLRPGRAIDYLEQVEAASGGAEEASDFFRLFMVPGMVHCAGGPGAWQADYLQPLVDWRETNRPPDRILATQPGPIAMGHIEPDDAVAQTRRFTRPLCVYPKLARYKGQGDDTDARNFVCR